MRQCDVREPANTLDYLVDCTLATVSDMALKKRRPKWEFERQIAIAQTGLDWMRQFGVNINPHSRAYSVLKEHNGSVASWAKGFIQC